MHGCVFEGLIRGRWEPWWRGCSWGGRGKQGGKRGRRLGCGFVIVKAVVFLRFSLLSLLMANERKMRGKDSKGETANRGERKLKSAFKAMKLLDQVVVERDGDGSMMKWVPSADISVVSADVSQERVVSKSREGGEWNELNFTAVTFEAPQNDSEQNGRNGTVVGNVDVDPSKRHKKPSSEEVEKEKLRRKMKEEAEFEAIKKAVADDCAKKRSTNEVDGNEQRDFRDMIVRCARRQNLGGNCAEKRWKHSAKDQDQSQLVPFKVLSASHVKTVKQEDSMLVQRQKSENVFETMKRYNELLEMLNGDTKSNAGMYNQQAQRVSKDVDSIRMKRCSPLPLASKLRNLCTMRKQKSKPSYGSTLQGQKKAMIRTKSSAFV